MTFIDYEKAFDKVDNGLLWQKLGQAHVIGKVLRIIRNLSQKTKACVRVNGEIFDIFDCNIGVRIFRSKRENKAQSQSTLFVLP